MSKQSLCSRHECSEASGQQNLERKLWLSFCIAADAGLRLQVQLVCSFNQFAGGSPAVCSCTLQGKVECLTAAK